LVEKTFVADAIIRRSRDFPTLQRWDAAACVTKALGFQGLRRAPLTNRKSDELRSETANLSNMYHWLRRLSGTSQTFGALGIAKAILWLWKLNFKGNPLYEQVTWLLFFKGSQQDGWFSSSDHTSTMKGLAIEESSSEILDLNKRAIALAKEARLSFRHEDETKDEQMQSPNTVTHLDSLSDTVTEQIDLINDGLRHSTVTKLTRSLGIGALVMECENLVSIIGDKDWRANDPRDKKKDDLDRFLFCLEELRSALEG
jgi:hypothetical protein